MLIILLFSFLAQSPLQAACTDWSAFSPPMEHAEIEGVRALASWQEMLLVADQDQLYLMDVAADGNLLIRASQTLPFMPTGMQVSANLVCVWGAQSLLAFELGPEALEARFSLEINEGWIYQAAWLDPWLYLGTHDSGLWWFDTEMLVFDTSQGAEAQLLGNLPFFGAVAEWQGYLMNSYGSFQVLDPVDPLAPLLVGEAAFQTGGSVGCGVAVSEDRAGVVLDDGYELALIDLSEPAAPSLLASSDIEWGGMWDNFNDYRLCLFNDEILLGNLSLGAQSFSPSTAGSLNLCGQIMEPPPWAEQSHIAMAGGRVFHLAEDLVLRSLPLFPPAEALNLRVRAMRAGILLEWDECAAAECSIYFCDTSDLDHGEEWIGTTSQNHWFDEDALHRGRGFYRLRFGRP
jgi:hypothetical protein